MPQGDGTGPDGKGPKKEDKGFPKKDGKGKGQGRRKNKRLRRCLDTDKN